MSSSIRRATAAGVLILSAGFAAAVPASASPARVSQPTAAHPPATPPTAAQAAAGWLGRQFAGPVLRSHKKPDPSSTVQAVLAFAASGVGGRQARAGISWLEKHFKPYVSPGGVDAAGALSYVILAAQSMGVDPTAFGGTKPANNLVHRLTLSQRTSGPHAGLFGSADPTFDGAFRQGLSLMALANQGLKSSASVIAGVRWLQNQQCADGGWESYRSDPATPCPAPDPGTFTGPDTNSTALAVEALVATGRRVPHALSFFEASQNSDGGFVFIGAASQSPDPDSTGEVIQALVALGQLANPALTRSGGATPPTALATFQLGCSAAKAKRGAYTFPPGPGPNLLATVQAIPGAAEVAFPLTAQTLQPTLPKLKCPAH